MLIDLSFAIKLDTFDTRNWNVSSSILDYCTLYFMFLHPNSLDKA